MKNPNREYSFIKNAPKVSFMKAQEVKSYLKKMGYKLIGDWDTDCPIKTFRGELFYSPIGKAFKKNAVCYSVALDLSWCYYEDNSELEIGLRVKVKVGSDAIKEKNLFSLNELSSFIDKAEDEYLSNRVISIR